MRSIALPAAALALIISGCPGAEKAAQEKPAPQVAKRRGFAVAEHARPERFPYRIWAFSGFEAKPESFGWFGAAETSNIPKYPGNATARRGTGPYGGFSALMVGMNPVPGPRMGKINKMYCRYFLKGADQATFQHFSLSSGDNCNIRVSGLKQGAWSELVLNFTGDSRRNDGSPGAFKEGERMDDLKVFVGTPGDGKEYEMVIDDVIFFSENPALPPEPEPFPQRVMFKAAFDTGSDRNSKPRFFPGEFEAVSGAGAPAGSYWVVAKAVPTEGGKSCRVLLEMKPPRPVGPNTKLRFRYWLKGASRMAVALHDATDQTARQVQLSGCKQGKWTTQYVTFSKDEKLSGEKFPTGNKVDSVAFTVAGGEGVQLYVDEVVLFDAGKPVKK